MRKSTYETQVSLREDNIACDRYENACQELQRNNSYNNTAEINKISYNI